METDRRISNAPKAKVTTVNQKIESGKVAIFSAEGRVIRDRITADLSADISKWTTEDLEDLALVIDGYAKARIARVVTETKNGD